jgi:hypothetical protein
MYRWSKGADAVLEHAAVDWDGVWSLLYAAGKGAFRLSLQLPLGPGAQRASAAMDICEARDEVSWAHPEVPMTAIAVDLGTVGPVVDVQATAAALVGLLDAAFDRLRVLQDADLDPDVRSLSRRVTWKVRTAREAITELAP